MKKILAILLLVSAVVGMAVPAMADDAGSRSAATNKADIDVSLDASNYAAHTVAVSLDNAKQENGIGTNVAASGSNSNGELATFDENAKAKDAGTGSALSGDANSRAASGEAENNGGGGQSVDDRNRNTHQNQIAPDNARSGAGISGAASGPSTSGSALNAAGVIGNRNTANQGGNTLTSGNVDNDVNQVNAIVQIVPVRIQNDQTVRQNAAVVESQHADSNPRTLDVELEQEFDRLRAGHDINI